MNCSEAHDLLDALADAELDERRGPEVASHAASCPRCTQRLAQIRRAGGEMRAIGRFAAPAHLERQVRGAIAIAPEATPRRRMLAVFGAGAVGGAALATAATLAFLWLGAAAPSPGALADYVSAHVRVQQAQLDPGILSGDPHTIRPWISGRSDLSPRVADLSDAGFPLLGARIDHVRGQAAVAVVYGRRKHRINLFVQAAETGQAQPVAGERHGYTVLSWRAGDLFFVAVSDVGETELQEFARLFRQRTAGADTAG